MVELRQISCDELHCCRRAFKGYSHSLVSPFVPERLNLTMLSQRLASIHRGLLQYQHRSLSLLTRTRRRADNVFSPTSHWDSNGFCQRPDDKQEQKKYPIISRSYHATQKQEIVPLIAVGALVTISYYSYRAVQRLNDDWDEYQHELHEYERWAAAANAKESTHKQLAIDFGTAFTKLAGTAAQINGVEVIITREGDRSFFNGIVYDGDEHRITGRAALERYYFDDTTNVILPFTALEKAKTLIPHVLQTPMQSLEMKYERQIVTVPTMLVHDAKAFTGAFGDDAVFVPEPVAALWGAQMNDLSMKLQPNDPILVIDVGGWTTQISIVQNHRITNAATLSFGGETFIEQCVQLLRQDQMTDARGLALLQWHSRIAVHELSTQSRVRIHVPYVFADPTQHHLEQDVARTVLEEAVERDIPNMIDVSALSSSLPAPKDLKSWYVSAVTRVLEDSEILPNNLKACVVVGGASRIPLVQRSLQSTLDMLLGPFEIEVVPSFKGSASTTTSPAEWTVLGAASLAPSFGYSLSNGLTLSAES